MIGCQENRPDKICLNRSCSNCTGGTRTDQTDQRISYVYIIMDLSFCLSFVLNSCNEIDSIVIKPLFPHRTLVTLSLLFRTCAVNRTTQRTTPRYTLSTVLPQGKTACRQALVPQRPPQVQAHLGDPQCPTLLKDRRYNGIRSRYLYPSSLVEKKESWNTSCSNETCI